MLDHIIIPTRPIRDHRFEPGLMLKKWPLSLTVLNIKKTGNKSSIKEIKKPSHSKDILSQTVLSYKDNTSKNLNLKDT